MRRVGNSSASIRTLPRSSRFTESFSPVRHSRHRPPPSFERRFRTRSTRAPVQSRCGCVSGFQSARPPARSIRPGLPDSGHTSMRTATGQEPGAGGRLLGLSVLRHHNLPGDARGQEPFTPDGYFGRRTVTGGVAMPTENPEEIAAFCSNCAGATRCSTCLTGTRHWGVSLPARRWSSRYPNSTIASTTNRCGPNPMAANGCFNFDATFNAFG